MARYITKAVRPATQPPQAYWETSPQPLPAPTVFPSEPQPTGLFDHEGRPIFKAPDPIGFLAFDPE